jgi:hypothetical protein
MHASSGIRTHDLSVRVGHALGREAIVIGKILLCLHLITIHAECIHIILPYTKSQGLQDL